MAQALYRKWRPQTFDDVVGQEHITTTLRNQIATGRIGHAYLFVGSRGCGKTTSARIFAKEVNIVDMGSNSPRARQIADAISESRALDVIEIDAASHTGVDDIREIRDRVNFQPSELKYKVYIVDEVHMLSTAAFNALLKTLEEPPPHVIFILATTDPQKIPATVLSRCQRFNFKRVAVDQIVGRLRQLCDAEAIEADDHALRLIARYATGSLRDAVSLLDQLASSNSMRITAADVREALGATDAATVRALADGLIARDPAAGFDAIQRAIDQGADARQIARQMVEYLRALMQVKLSPKQGAVGDPSSFAPSSFGFAQDGSGQGLTEAERVELAAHAEKLSMPQLSRGIRAFSNAINEMRATTDAQLPLEMAYLDCVAGDDETGAEKPQAQAQPTTTTKARSPKAPEEKHATSAQPSPSATREEASSPKVESSSARTASSVADDLPQSGPQSGLTLDALRAQWKQFVKEVDTQNKPAAALLRSCHLHDVSGGVVHIRADHDLFRSRLEDQKNKNSIVAVLNRMFNGKYEVRVFVNQAQQEIDPNDDPVLRAARKLGGTVRTE